MSPSQISKLRKLVKLAEQILAEVDSAPGRRRAEKSVRTRRSGKELLAFRKTLRTERKRGVPVAEIARKHGVTTAYIYQLGL